MKHLIICREYPPAPGGGIGSYVYRMAHSLAACGETVHVIAQAYAGADSPVQEHHHGRLVIHRIPYENWKSLRRGRPHPSIIAQPAAAFFKSDYAPQAFAWLAGLLAERLVQEEGIDVIEAQEYEAPLYFFLQRRLDGQGPNRRPPSIIHLHSPTEWIARSNGWDFTSPSVQTAIRLENFCITHADALLCPSVHLARQVEARFQFPSGSVQVIPLPKDPQTFQVRQPAIWEHGPICYAGRLEPRKGVLEWLQAVMQICREDPHARFEFAGENILGRNPIESQLIWLDQVPRQLRAKVFYHGPLPRARIPEFLARARIAVVPSRWENFPYACIEAMSSGLPVIATRQGGMAEMIRDGESGWLTDRADPDGLAAALRRALQTSPARLAEMGAQASVDIEQMCASDTVTQRQLHFRRQLIQSGNAANSWMAARRNAVEAPIVQPANSKPGWPAEVFRLVLHRPALLLEFPAWWMMSWSRKGLRWLRR